MPNPFKPGDKVKCINDELHAFLGTSGMKLIKGDIYIVESIYDTQQIYIQGCTSAWWANRFELVEIETAKKAQIKIDYLAINKDICGG